MARIPGPARVSYAGLIFMRGLDRALGAGVDEVNVVVCMSDTFSERNQNVPADEAMPMAADVTAAPDRGSVHDDHTSDRFRSAVPSRARWTGARRGVRAALGRVRCA